MSPRDREGHEPRDRRPTVHQPQHRRLPPTQSVPQAPSQIPACMPPIITPPRCSSSPPARGGEQSLPPRSAATQSARARGLADLIDNLGAALPAAAVFLSTRAGCGQIPVGRRPAFVWRCNFWAAPPETRLARKPSTGESVVLARSLLTMRLEQKSTPVSSCLLERTNCKSEAETEVGRRVGIGVAEVEANEPGAVRVEFAGRGSRFAIGLRGASCPDSGATAGRPDQQRCPASPAWPLTQRERKPPSAGRAGGRRLLVCTRSSDVGSADRVAGSRLKRSCRRRYRSARTGAA